MPTKPFSFTTRLESKLILVLFQRPNTKHSTVSVRYLGIEKSVLWLTGVIHLLAIMYCERGQKARKGKDWKRERERMGGREREREVSKERKLVWKSGDGVRDNEGGS